MTSLEDLPLPILCKILSLLPTTNDLAGARLSSPELRRASRHVSSAAAVANLVALLAGSLRSLAVAVDAPAGPDVEVDDGDDLHVTAEGFLATWLPVVAGRLTSLEIRDCWAQSCYRPARALVFIADQCHNLLHLEIRNAWLSITGLKPMNNLTSLTLVYIRLDDKNLEMLNECFSSLQVLNLINVGGLSEPMINLSRLRVCTWTVSNYPLSLSVRAPNLVELKLKCGEPKALCLETPLLSKLDFTVGKLSGAINFGKFDHLQELSVKTSDMCSLVWLFTDNNRVKKLVLESGLDFNSYDHMQGSGSIDIMKVFPYMDKLTLRPMAWAFFPEVLSLEDGRSLDELTVCLPRDSIDAGKIIPELLRILKYDCFRRVVMKLPTGVCVPGADRMIAQYSSDFPKVQQKWSTWVCDGDAGE